MKYIFKSITLCCIFISIGVSQTSYRKTGGVLNGSSAYEVDKTRTTTIAPNGEIIVIPVKEEIELQRENRIRLEIENQKRREANKILNEKSRTASNAVPDTQFVINLYSNFAKSAPSANIIKMKTEALKDGEVNRLELINTMRKIYGVK